MSLSIRMFNPRGLYLERVGQGARECRYIQFRNPSNIIGRSPDADVCFNTINANTVSREHSVVTFNNGRMYIDNLSQTNPTFLNDDKVIRKTEVEEGDLIGFGSKPNVIYPNLSEERIFIYECKSINRSRQQNVIILDDSEDDEEIEIIDENENSIENAPTSAIEYNNENIDPKSKINDFEVAIETSSIKSKADLVIEHPKRSIELPKTVSSDISLHIDTVESINDLSQSESESSSEDENSVDHIIKADNMLNVKIIVKKLTDQELEQWKPKIEKEISESESESEHEYSDIQNEPEQKTLPEREYSDSKFLYNKLNFSKSKFDNLAKSLEMREKIRSLVDDDDSDDGLFSNIPKKSNVPSDEKKGPEMIEKSVTNRSEIIEKSQRFMSSHKRRMSTNDKDSYSHDKKLKQGEPTTVKKMYKFPGASTNITSNVDKSKIKDPIKRRSTISEMKNDTDSSDSMNKVSKFNKILKRRMSLCPTTPPKIILPHSNVKKKKIPQRRQTISESRFTEIDMFSKASELRMRKWGLTGKPSDVNPQKVVPKKPEVVNVTKKSTNRDDVRVDKNIVSQEVKKILDPILNRLDPKVSPLSPNKVVSTPNTQNKSDASKNDNLDYIKKASLVKTKVTPVTRGECLTEAIPLTRTKPALRRSSTFNEQPSTSKDAMSVALFYDKYVKPNEVETVKKVPSIDPIPADVIDSLNAKINMEMKQQHEQLAVETTLTINEEESPVESDNEELNLDTDDDMDKDDDSMGFYRLIDSFNTTPNEISSPQLDPDFGSPMKDDPRGKTKWVSLDQTEEEKIEKTFELQKFPTTPFLTTTIHVHHEKPVEGIKKILKVPPLYVSPSKQNHKKRVSFNEFNLVNIVHYRIDDTPSNTCKQPIAHVPPMRSPVRNPKYYESAACAELLEWDWKWLSLNNELPEGWKVEKHKHTYDSLQEYKNELKTVMNVELLKKLSSKYKLIAGKEKTWNFMTVKERKDEQNNHIKLVLGCDSKDMKQGTMLLLKVRDTNSVTRKPIDINFFGYVTAVNDRGELKLDTYCKELRKEKAVLKSIFLVHLRSDIKLFSVINCIRDTRFMKLFLNPSLNKMDRYEGMTSVSLEFKMTSIKLCSEQRTIIKKISHEFNKNDTEKIIFINGGAGTGKTYLMLAAVLNFKFSLKDKRRYLICASTMSGIDEISEILHNMPHSSALNIVRLGYRENFVGRSRKLGLNEQVQQKLNNGLKGKGFKEIQKEIIENADIILSTMRSCYDLFDYQLPIEACFIDEANFAIDAELMILVQLNIKKMVLIGDEYQLEPTQSLVYKETRSNNSYFNRVIDYYKSLNYASAPVFTLLTQHRMNKELFHICNKHVYNDTMTYNTVNSMTTASFPFKPFAVFTLDVTPNDQKYMIDEVNFFCMKLCEILPKNVSIGIVNGFPSQRDKNRIKLDSNDRRIECLAVETMQGFEKDVIILTLRNTETYFMHNFNRINVALTRARKALYICSNMNMILYPNEAGLFVRLKDDARKRDLYHVIQKFDFDRLYNMLRK
ncbi:uncharacterized protein [Chironomus tepperi]|uniref:uncharacterized protein n=1 Tax=Chironomus tepperi TaxID=113505 RepID=UPI00391F5710